MKTWWALPVASASFWYPWTASEQITDCGSSAPLIAAVVAPWLAKKICLRAAYVSP